MNTKPTTEPTFAVTRKVALRAAENMDGKNAFCFHVCEDGKFCGRFKVSVVHGDHHEFVSLADLIKGIV